MTHFIWRTGFAVPPSARHRAGERQMNSVRPSEHAAQRRGDLLGKAGCLGSLPVGGGPKGDPQVAAVTTFIPRLGWKRKSILSLIQGLAKERRCGTA